MVAEKLVLTYDKVEDLGVYIIKNGQRLWRGGDAVLDVATGLPVFVQRVTP